VEDSAGSNLPLQPSQLYYHHEAILLNARKQANNSTTEPTPDPLHQATEMLNPAAKDENNCNGKIKENSQKT
jgi:hypothetical protein